MWAPLDPNIAFSRTGFLPTGTLEAHAGRMIKPGEGREGLLLWQGLLGLGPRDRLRAVPSRPFPELFGFLVGSAVGFPYSTHQSVFLTQVGLVVVSHEGYWKRSTCRRSVHGQRFDSLEPR